MSTLETDLNMPTLVSNSVHTSAVPSAKPSISASGKQMTVALLASLLVALPAQACGPDFPLQLLSDRGQHLQQLPEALFATEILALAIEIPKLPLPAKSFSSQYDWQQERQVSATEQAEQQLLPAAQAAVIALMRQQSNAAAALQSGQALPEELKLYTAGAVAFAQQDKLSAERLWRQLLALPPAQQQNRRSWAMYSLARLLLQQATTAATAEAQQWLQTLQQEVSAGLADPLQLAVASLGEQARLHLSANDWQQAIGLYAAQAGYDESGRASLLQLSKQLLALPDAELTALLSQPKVAQLLSRYLLTQQQALSYQAPEQLTRLTNLLLQHPTVRLDNALPLAALSYQQGQFDLVEALLSHAEDSPLRWWLTAKMALRQNDLTQAADAYAKAARAFPVALPKPALQPDRYAEVPRPQLLQQLQLDTQCRLQAEAGVLQLQRGDYLAAMQLLYQSGAQYWQDTAYIAERVLTLSELQQFVDQQVPMGQPKAPSEWSYFGDTEPNTLLRQLLARRLLRAGDFANAQRYFVEPNLQQLASRYVTAVEHSQPNWLSPVRQALGLPDVSRASALFQAASLTRQHGLELLGFELAPDYQVFYGQFEFYQPEPAPPQQWSIPAQEQQRIASSSAVPDKRFHYRYVAADLAAQSADWLPPNSQAFAATLCYASTWLINRDPALAQQYYQRYLAQGPYVSWGADIGIRCPAPDFASAANRANQNLHQQSQQWLRQQREPIVAAALFAFSIGLGLWWRRRGIQRQS